VVLGLDSFYGWILFPGRQCVLPGRFYDVEMRGSADTDRGGPSLTPPESGGLWFLVAGGLPPRAYLEGALSWCGGPVTAARTFRFPWVCCSLKRQLFALWPGFPQ
jgi:hypothetical protein